MKFIDRAIDATIAPRPKELGFVRRHHTWNRREFRHVQALKIQLIPSARMALAAFGAREISRARWQDAVCRAQVAGGTSRMLASRPTGSGTR